MTSLWEYVHLSKLTTGFYLNEESIDNDEELLHYGGYSYCMKSKDKEQKDKKDLKKVYITLLNNLQEIESSDSAESLVKYSNILDYILDNFNDNNNINIKEYNIKIKFDAFKDKEVAQSVSICHSPSYSSSYRRIILIEPPYLTRFCDYMNINDIREMNDKIKILLVIVKTKLKELLKKEK